MGSVLDMLNAINGIIFVQIRWDDDFWLKDRQIDETIHSPKDIANLKNEIEKRQNEGTAEISDEVKEGAPELKPIDEAIAKAPAAVQSWINLFCLTNNKTIKRSLVI